MLEMVCRGANERKEERGKGGGGGAREKESERERQGRVGRLRVVDGFLSCACVCVCVCCSGRKNKARKQASAATHNTCGGSRAKWGKNDLESTLSRRKRGSRREASPEPRVSVTSSLAVNVA